MSEASIGLFCPSCSHYGIHPVPSARTPVECSACHCEMTIEPASSLEACPLCRNEEFYSRKDLPQQLGCAAVAFTIVVSSVAYALWGVLASFLVLGLATLADFILYHRLGEVVVCYRCQSEDPGTAGLDVGQALRHR